MMAGGGCPWPSHHETSCLSEYALTKRSLRTRSPAREQVREQVEQMPVASRRDRDPGPDVLHKAGGAGAFVAQGGGVRGRVEAIAPPPEAAGSDVHAGVFVSLELPDDAAPGVLALRYEPQHAKLDRDTLRLARFDELDGVYRVVEPSALGRGNYVWGLVPGAGRYAIVGLRKDAGSLDQLLKKKGDGTFEGELPQRPFFPQLELYESLRRARDVAAKLPQWDSLGPSTLAGVALVVRVDPATPDRVYALSQSGGLWVLDDASQYPARTWRPLTDRLPTTSMQRGFAIAPAPLRRLYLVDAARQLRRSDDGGATWHAAATLPGDCYNLFVDAAQPRLLWAATTAGLVQYTFGGADGATVTAQATLFPGDITDVAIDAENGQMYAGLRSTGVLERRPDGTWVTIFTSATAKNNAGVVRIALGPGPAASRSMIVRIDDQLVRRADPKAKFVSIGAPGFQASASPPWWCNVVGISPTNPKLVLAGYANLERSEDAGATWTIVSGYNGVNHADHQDLVFDAAHPGRVWVATDGGVYRSDDDGKTWTSYNEGLVSGQLWNAGHTREVIVTGQDHWGIVGTTAPNQWQSLSGGAFEWSVALGDPWRAGRFFVGRSTSIDIFWFGRSEPKWESFGNGFTLATVPGNTTYVSPYAIGVNPYLGDAKVLLVGCDTPGCVRRAAAGQANPTWSIDAGINLSGDAVRAIGFVRLKPWIAFALTAYGKVFRLDDYQNASTWRSVGTVGGTGSDGRALVSSPTHSAKLWVLWDNAVYLSTTAGTTWTNASGSGTAKLPSTALHSLCCHPNGVEVYVGSPDGVYVTTDDGATWSRIGGLPHADITQLYFEDQHLNVATYGRGMWRLRTPVTG